MKISQEDVILIFKISTCQGCGSQRLFSEFPDMGRKLGSIDSLLNRICKTITIAFLSTRHSVQSGGGSCAKPKRHRSAHEILHETGIPHSSVHKTIQSAV